MATQLQEINFKVNASPEVDNSQGEGLRLDYFSGMQEVASNVKSFLMVGNGDGQTGEREFGQIKLFDSKLKPDPIRSAAEEVVLGGWTQDELTHLTRSVRNSVRISNAGEQLPASPSTRRHQDRTCSAWKEKLRK